MNLSKETKKHPLLAEDTLSVFFWQLAQLCRAGVSWADSAQLLLEETDDPTLRVVLQTIQDELQFGGQLSKTLQKTESFPIYAIHMLEIGELSGRMEQVLEALSVYYRRQSAMTAAVGRAVTYPAVMAAMIAFIFLILILRVLPIFTKTFENFGMSAPAYWFGTSAIGKYIAIAFAIFLFCSAVSLLIVFRGPHSMRLFSRGKTGIAIARGQFASAMAMLLSSGIPMEEAMRNVAILLEKTPLASSIAACRDEIEHGKLFYKAISESRIFTGLQAGILAAGFRAGHSETAMEELAERCCTDAETRLEWLLSRFEYLLILLLCGAVGAVLLSIMLPLLGVLSSIGG